MTRHDGVSFKPEGYPGSILSNPRDPRPPTFGFSENKEILDLPVPRFLVDQHYVGPVPPRMVTLFCLNDNIQEGFLKQEIQLRMPELKKNTKEIEKLKVLKFTSTNQIHELDLLFRQRATSWTSKSFLPNCSASEAMRIEAKRCAHDGLKDRRCY